MDIYEDGFVDFVEESQLTVTITLNEYRTLVAEVAKKDHDIQNATSTMFEKNQKIVFLTEENKSLKKENFDLRKQLEELKDDEEEE